jgi:hypothetical protein
MIRRVGLLVLLITVGAVATGCMAFSTADSPFHQGVRNQGSWVEPGHASGPGNDNYLVGWVYEQDPFTDWNVRNYFTFDVTDACEAEQVILRATRFLQTAPITYALYDVSTSAGDLNVESGENHEIYADLGSGASFGTFNVPQGDDSDVLTFSLNSAGVAAFNAARGGFFSIGGAAPNASQGQYLFGASGFSQGVQHLIAVCADQPT